MMPEQVRPGGDVVVHVLADNSAVVFNETTQQLLSFDPLATYLWCRWEDGAETAELAGGLDTVAGRGGESAQEMVDRCLAMWRHHKLIGAVDGGSLNGAVPHRPPPREVRRGHSGRRRVPPPGRGHVATGLRIGGENYRLCYGSRALAKTVRPLLAHLEQPIQGSAAAEFLLRADGGRFTLWQDGNIVEHCARADEVPPMVKFCLNVDLLERGAYSLAFHSAAVVRDGRALLLPAASGRGKSTLTAALLHDGWGYLSDDSVLLDDAGEPVRRPASCHIRGVGFDLCLKEKAWPILQPLYPAIDRLPIYRRGDGHRVRYLPPRSRLPDAARAYPIEWIVFPHFQRGSECSLQPLAAAAALQRLLREAFAPSQRLSRAGFGMLARLVEEKHCYALTYDSLAAAAAALEKL